MLGESPYIGKARHKRNTFTSDSVDAGDMRLPTGDLAYTEKLDEESRRDLERGTETQIVQVVILFYMS